MPRGDKSQMEKFAFFIPTNVEQKKIAMFLSMLDERITTQNKIIEDLKKLKADFKDFPPRHSLYYGHLLQISLIHLSQPGHGCH